MLAIANSFRTTFAFLVVVGFTGYADAQSFDYKAARNAYDMGDYADAANYFQMARTTDKTYEKSRYYLGDCYVRLAKFASAQQVFEQLVRLNPESSANRNALAWFLATVKDKRFRDGKAAIEHAIKACELTRYRSAGVLDTAAAAYAANGKFLVARSFARQAIKKSSVTDIKEIVIHSQLYDSKKTITDGFEEPKGATVFAVNRSGMEVEIKIVKYTDPDGFTHTINESWDLRSSRSGLLTIDGREIKAKKIFFQLNDGFDTTPAKGKVFTMEYSKGRNLRVYLNPEDLSSAGQRYVVTKPPVLAK